MLSRISVLASPFGSFVFQYWRCYYVYSMAGNEETSLVTRASRTSGVLVHKVDVQFEGKDRVEVEEEGNIKGKKPDTPSTGPHGSPIPFRCPQVNTTGEIWLARFVCYALFRTWYKASDMHSSASSTPPLLRTFSSSMKLVRLKKPFPSIRSRGELLFCSLHRSRYQLWIFVH